MFLQRRDSDLILVVKSSLILNAELANLDQIVLLVATIRAIKMHGGGPKVVPGAPLSVEYVKENLGLVEKGLPNVTRHIEVLKTFGVPVVVAINAFSSDSPAEIELIRKSCKAAGAFDAVETTHWADGGKGAEKLAQAIVLACDQPSNFQLLYKDTDSLKAKIETICTKLYRAAGVTYSPEAEKQLEYFTKLGFDKLPVCMAKTHLSFSADPALKGAPTGFVIPIRDVRACIGAGFIYPLVGEMSTMPGLGTRPAFYDIDVDEDGNIQGLF